MCSEIWRKTLLRSLFTTFYQVQKGYTNRQLKIVYGQLRAESTNKNPSSCYITDPKALPLTPSDHGVSTTDMYEKIPVLFPRVMDTFVPCVLQIIRASTNPEVGSMYVFYTIKLAIRSSGKLLSKISNKL